MAIWSGLVVCVVRREKKQIKCDIEIFRQTGESERGEQGTRRNQGRTRREEEKTEKGAAWRKRVRRGERRRGKE